MALIIRDDTNTPRTVTALVIRDGTNTPRTITELWVRDSSNTPRLVYSTSSPLSAIASDYNVAGNDAGTGTATTNATTITPSGGVAPYTYAWTTLSYDGGVPPNINAPTSATTTFTQTSIGPGVFIFASFRCTVTDAVLATTTVDINATFYSVA